MALYRLRGVTDNQKPYVYTNPHYDTVIMHKDRAFVLGAEIPDELQGDFYEMMEKEKGIELSSDKTKDSFGGNMKNKTRTGGFTNPQSAHEVRNNNEHILNENKRTPVAQQNLDDQDEVFPLGLKSSKN